MHTRWCFLGRKMEKSNKKLIKKGQNRFILAIDPGLSGYFCLTNGNCAKFFPMPLFKFGNYKDIDFGLVVEVLRECKKIGGNSLPVYLERAVSFGMGTKSAFNYGRGFATLEIAVRSVKLALTLVEPAKWAKVMHAGIKKDLKPKAKSQIAVRRLFPKFAELIPKGKGGKFHEGAVDALLIGGFVLKSETDRIEKGKKIVRALVESFKPDYLADF